MLSFVILGLIEQPIGWVIQDLMLPLDLGQNAALCAILDLTSFVVLPIITLAGHFRKMSV